MNLLFLVHRIPFPPNKGDKIRSWNELRYLAARHRVHVGCLADQSEDLVHLPRLNEITASCEVAPLGMWGARRRALQALATGAPLSVRWFESPRLQRWVEATARRESLDAVLLFSSSMATYVRGLEIPVVMDFCDVDSDKWRQYAASASLPMRPIYALEARRLRRFEAEVLARCSAATLVAERERVLWADFPAALRDKVHVVPNGVDLEFFSPSAAQCEPHGLVFTGAMDYYANVDAVVFFAEEVLPRIRAAIPDATFTIVGSRPTAAVRCLAQRPGVAVTGFVDDVRPYYAHAALCVVPLRIARGIQNKVLEAMAMGRPVLASSCAAEGLGAADALRIADTADDWARQAIALLREPQAAEALGAAARRFVEQHYVWDHAMAKLEALLEGAAARRPSAELPSAIPSRSVELVAAKS